MKHDKYKQNPLWCTTEAVYLSKDEDLLLADGEVGAFLEEIFLSCNFSIDNFIISYKLMKIQCTNLLKHITVTYVMIKIQ